MIKIEHVVLPSPDQWAAVIRGMRNPMNSWEKSDSSIGKAHRDTYVQVVWPNEIHPGYFLGTNDSDLMQRLAKGGSVHAKYRRMITVHLDITAPLYWWKEFDTYKVGTVANSCSTMHKIQEKEFTLDDFSCEHLMDSDLVEPIEQKIPDGVTVWADDDTGCLAVTCCGNYHEGHSYEDTLIVSQKDILDMFIIPALNANREAYFKTKSKPMKDSAAREALAKKYWWQIIQLLPSSYNQKRTVMLSYEVLTNIYRRRKNHKLDEWRELCKWIETLPYSEIITMEDLNADDGKTL